MPFFLRKSVSIGPLRFNLSKSGIGVSAGLTGLRFGAGPRGRYVHAGRGGIYYRKTFSSNPEGLLFNSGRPVDSPPVLPAKDVDLQSVDSGSVLQMVDASSADLLKELNDKQRVSARWPLAFVSTILICAGLWIANSPLWIALIAAVVGITVTIYVYTHDVIRRTVPMLYDLEPEVEEKYKQLFEYIEELGSSRKVWVIDAQGAASDAKYQSGATHVVRRQQITITSSLPPYVKSNVEPPAIPAGRQTLYFFPDMLLVLDGKSFGAVDYRNLNVEVRETRFVEQDAVPGDALVVGKTWKYVNKSGGPDRRFRDNREIPLVAYEELQLTSSTGLNEIFQISRQGVGAKIKQALTEFTSITSGVKPD